MATEPNKPIILRQVLRDPVADQKVAQKTGILFESLSEMNCPHCGAVLPLENAKPLSSLLCPACAGKAFVPGRVGGFLLHEHIGEGEMGTVYRATDESLNRDVAVKLVRGCHAEDPESLDRLHREACAAGKINHPRVAQVYALNFSNGHPYLVMELVTGQDFAQKLEHEGRIEERAALRMALDVADGLSALNREGLVHGDIKPGNIVLDRDGNAKLVDFGLSGMMRQDENGNLMGTPNYIAPELLRGAPDTHRSDIYSLGATLYHLLSGHPPLDGEKTIDILKARLFRHPVPIGTLARHVSLATRRMVMRMLESDPEKRQTNSDAVAVEIRDALAQLDSPTPVAAPPDSAGVARRFLASIRLALRPLPATPHPRRLAFFAVSLALVAVIGLLISVGEPSFDRALAWVRREVAGRIITLALTVSLPKPETAAPVQESADHKPNAAPTVSQPKPETSAPVVRETAGNMPNAAPTVSQPKPETSAPVVREDFTVEANPIWRSINLGERVQGGSTMQMGETMLVQGSGTDMWKGVDHCRFVWTKTSGNYALSTKIMAIANNNLFAVTGLLLKGDDPTLGPGLLFGFLGSGNVFLQTRLPSSKTLTVKRSERPLRLPCSLKIARYGKTFEAWTSDDDQTWTPFAACELDLPAGNTIGFCVSAQDPNTLATAKFASIRLLTPVVPDRAKTNTVPATVTTPVSDARKP